MSRLLAHGVRYCGGSEFRLAELPRKRAACAQNIEEEPNCDVSGDAFGLIGGSYSYSPTDRAIDDALQRAEASANPRVLFAPVWRQVVRARGRHIPDYRLCGILLFISTTVS